METNKYQRKIDKYGLNSAYKINAANNYAIISSSTCSQSNTRTNSLWCM